MKQKRKIDDIYREGLQNIETPPPADSWEFISSRLPEEKNEKVLPLWMKWVGMAAAFALLLITLNFTFLETSFTEPVVNGDPDWNTPASPAPRQPEAQPVVADRENKQLEDESKSGNSGENRGTTEDASSEPPRLVEQKFSPNAYASGVSKSEVVALSEATGGNSVARNGSLEGETRKGIPFTTEPLAETAGDSSQNIAQIIPDPKGFAYEGEEQTEGERLFAGPEPETSTAEKRNFLKRLSISSTTGAVYLNVNQGSTLGEGFSAKGGSSEVSLAYGVNVAYAISEKLKIRSGISKVDFNYSTPQLDYSAVMSSGTVSSDPARMGVLLSAQGNLEQEFAFIEIPAELEFTLIDKKVGLNIIGGASALLLQENNMTMITPGFTADLGEAENLNELSFSANLGLGVHYKFAPRLRLNLEPVVKYQLNAFDHSRGFNSYYYGIYLGISYQF